MSSATVPPTLRSQGPDRRGRRPAAGVLVAGAAAVALALGVAPVAAQPMAGPSAAVAPAAASVGWRACGGGFECATVRVPLDYDRPDGRRIELALIRLPATNRAARIGSLFTNPGGPGGSGVQFVRDGARFVFPPKVRAHFDIVGFDPRGVGDSTPVRCFATAAEQQRFLRDYPLIPITPAEFHRATAKVAELARRCQERVGWLLPHLSTADVARDLDLLRAAVGDRRLSYVGYSYGTYLGATYANLFPERVRALALDALVDAPAYTAGPRPSTTFVRQHSDQGSSETLDEFFRLCAQAGSRCALGAYGRPAEKFAALARQLRQQPITLPDGATFGYAELVSLTVGALYVPSVWDELAQILQQLYTATRPAEAVGQLRDLVPQPAAAPYNNNLEALLASFCGETANPSDPHAYRRLAEQADRRAPYVGAYWTYISLACSRWPARAQDRFTGPWSTSTSTPALLLNPRFDPATPHRNAVTMTRLLAGSRLLTVNGWGHAALGTRSACADGALERYLIEQTLPRPGATCPTGIVPFANVPSGQRNTTPDSVVPSRPL